MKPVLRSLPTGENLKTKTAKKTSIRATCYDERSLVTGQLTQVQATSAEFVCKASEARPLFPKKTWLRLNIFNESSQQEQTVEARLINYFRKEGKWVYKLLWKEMPELLRLN